MSEYDDTAYAGFLRDFLGVLPDGPDDERNLRPIDYLPVRGQDIILPSGRITVSSDSDANDHDTHVAEALAAVLNAMINLIAQGFTYEVHGQRVFCVGLDALYDLDTKFVELFDV